MKKFLVLILICFVQISFSQNTKTNSKKTTTTTKEPEIGTIKSGNQNNSKTIITIDEPINNSQTAIQEDNSVYNTAGIDVKPNFPGGIDKFYAFVDANFKKPQTTTDIKGKKIYITFIVEKDGTLTDIKVLRDAGYATGDEAIRVLKECPKWNPGEHKGKKIRVLYSLPITMK